MGFSSNYPLNSLSCDSECVFSLLTSSSTYFFLTYFNWVLMAQWCWIHMWIFCLQVRFTIGRNLLCIFALLKASCLGIALNYNFSLKCLSIVGQITALHNPKCNLTLTEKIKLTSEAHFLQKSHTRIISTFKKLEELQVNNSQLQTENCSNFWQCLGGMSLTKLMSMFADAFTLHETYMFRICDFLWY